MWSGGWKRLRGGNRTEREFDVAGEKRLSSGD
jgi:hypothetical protein